MTHDIIPQTLFISIAVALAGCASPLMQDRDLGNPARIADAPDRAVVTESDGLTLAATPLKETVELGEPIYLAVRVANPRRESLTIVGDLRPGDGLIDAFAQGPSGRSFRLAPLSEGDFEHSTALAAGESAGDVFPIFFGANGWNFTQPGAYRIYVELKAPGPNGYLAFRSEAAVVNVTDSAAGRLLFEADRKTSTQAGKFLLWRSGDHLQDGQRHLAMVAERYPESPLAAYITAARVRSFSEPFANYISGEVRPPDCERASILRSEINFEALPVNLRIEDALSQAKCFAESERWEEARGALQIAAALAEQRLEFTPLARAAAEMQKHLDNLPQ